MQIQTKEADGAFGARITGIDLSKPVPGEDFARIILALGHHGFVCFPRQSMTPGALKAFSGRFGGLQISVSGSFNDPEHPEVMTLSNMRQDGKPLGLADAGQDWHTDMSYNATIGYVNVLHALHVPYRDGEPLGDTLFADTKAAFRDLPDEMKARLDGMTVTHDFEKFWESMRARPGSTRAPLTAEQKAKRPPSVHPIFITHPVTGERALYANPGYATRINELEPGESDKVLQFLFDHQLQEKYIHRHRWSVGDVLIWDNLVSLHNAVADYRPDEPRMMIRCQVSADRVFDPDFVRATLAPLERAA
ncbi:MAG: TauD/TfdA family dioxygenase [Rhodobacteraceae bacterium]|nr:TauD/TfdA family dioxygenase [Paracoccaceae bacterium]